MWENSWSGEKQLVPPLRCCLSSRPERSGVEGPAASLFHTSSHGRLTVAQDYRPGPSSAKAVQIKEIVIAGVDFAGLTPRKSANRESGSWQVRVCSGPELLITGSKHPGLHPGPFSAVPSGLVLLCKPNRALRAGLLSAVPPGLESRQGRTWSCLVQIQAGGSTRCVQPSLRDCSRIVPLGCKN